ncbi:YbgC/FadM family acyl-CoA thioesterase [Azospirillum doebereinerae]|uniref:YbgC/FadM family acyl-CoA thioesterase n=1 Tax=Azospirillum doebereinerae TaxID=92933 RepID=A0A3S0XMF5_9PROT|nr:YbgC/FadM family acyl-CoA thioesterase [Azospirillum doebereinerae]MCG5240352.1 YbgC/FadM family acyl-CoA thioesterase [Azospirillum doebereinerae]RUQ70222.1 YbgC/FadM family acyl-CoA thioesterase [Azospirillum doebereinerae]
MSEGPSLSGWFAEDGSHRYPLRVYYEDTDAGGIVYHANYLRFAERARSEMLTLLGFRQTEMAKGVTTGSDVVTGVSFAVRRATIDFTAPAKLEDTLEVDTRIADIRGASFAVAQIIRRDGRALVRADLQLVTINPAGRAVRLPEAVRAAIDALRRRQSPHPVLTTPTTAQTRD